jgi:hypothetical protein
VPKHWIRVERPPGMPPSELKTEVFDCVDRHNGVLERLDWEPTAAAAIAVVREVATTDMDGIRDCLGPFNPSTERAGMLATEEVIIRERD